MISCTTPTSTVKQTPCGHHNPCDHYLGLVRLTLGKCRSKLLNFRRPRLLWRFLGYLYQDIGKFSYFKQKLGMAIDGRIASRLIAI